MTTAAKPRVARIAERGRRTTMRTKNAMNDAFANHGNSRSLTHPAPPMSRPITKRATTQITTQISKPPTVAPMDLSLSFIRELVPLVAFYRCLANHSCVRRFPSDTCCGESNASILPRRGLALSPVIADRFAHIYAVVKSCGIPSPSM